MDVESSDRLGVASQCGHVTSGVEVIQLNLHSVLLEWVHEVMSAHMIAPGTGGTGNSVRGVVKAVDDCTASRAT